MRLQSRRVHLPDHGLHLHGQLGDARAGGRPGCAGDDRAPDHRSVRARAWRRDPHGAAQTRIQPGRLLRSLLGHHRGGRGPDPGAAPLGADGGAGPGSRPTPRRRWHARGARATARRARSALGLTTVLELVAGILLAAGAVYFVLRPIFRPQLTGNGNREPGNGSDGEDPEDDFSPRAVALRALKEIEFDRATGKLSDADYDALKNRYTAEALTALRAERPGSEKRETGNVAAPPFPVSRVPFPVCPTHGPRPESDAQFCSDCGRRLATAPGYCARRGARVRRPLLPLLRSARRRVAAVGSASWAWPRSGSPSPARIASLPFPRPDRMPPRSGRVPLLPTWPGRPSAPAAAAAGRPRPT